MSMQYLLLTLTVLITSISMAGCLGEGSPASTQMPPDPSITPPLQTLHTNITLQLTAYNIEDRRRDAPFNGNCIFIEKVHAAGFQSVTAWATAGDAVFSTPTWEMTAGFPLTPRDDITTQLGSFPLQVHLDLQKPLPPKEDLTRGDDMAIVYFATDEDDIGLAYEQEIHVQLEIKALHPKELRFDWEGTICL